jgi:hypothetical protein
VAASPRAGSCVALLGLQKWILCDNISLMQRGYQLIAACGISFSTDHSDDSEEQKTDFAS